jgi:uncharacterized RDD family membrane protein YckC
MTTDNLQPSAKMVQCSVTGKMVPEDEIVTIQGHRVCAEGKAILLERLKSGEAMPGEREKPTVLRRFGCIFVDGLIVGVPTAVISGMIAAAGASPVVIGMISLLATVGQIVYFGQMHGKFGQTVGKMAGKLIVINEDGSPITLQTAYIRALAYTGPSIISGLAVLSGVRSFVAIAGIIVGVYGLANVLVALVDRNQQRAIHDRIAGTRVVEKE